MPAHGLIAEFGERGQNRKITDVTFVCDELICDPPTVLNQNILGGFSVVCIATDLPRK